MARVALGKGLGALIQPKLASPEPAPGERVQQVSLGDIVPSPLQPRSEFRSEQLKELVDSIREQGIIQPLTVRKKGSKYELIAGERRWRAAREAGLKEAPVIVRSATDQEVLELALIENLQREDLNPIEEATAYARLTREFNLTQEAVANRVGKSRAAVANMLRLLDLDDEVQGWLTQGRLSVGHAKVLLALKSRPEQRLLAETILRKGASVRVAERMVGDFITGSNNSQGSKGRKTGAPSGSSPSLAPAILHMQNRLQEKLATRVEIHHGQKSGKILIEYYGNDDLNRLARDLGIRDL